MNDRGAPEWPTYAILCLCYSGWITICLLHPYLGWLFVPICAVFVALHSSLQHEALHGHPTRSAALNEALVFPALGLAIPYRVFRRSHLRHHCDANLTDPYDDPESWYRAEREWAGLSPPMRVVLRANQTLAGRMLLGPGLSMIACWADLGRQVMRGDGFAVRAILFHGLGVTVTLGFAVGFAGVPVPVYVIAAYLGYSLLMVRTFAEHQAAESTDARTAIVEAGPGFSLLFLNNNLHAVHHAHPRAPWYSLPGLYRAHREEVLRRNGGYLIAGYRSLFRRHFLRAKEPVAHPFLRRE